MVSEHTEDIVLIGEPIDFRAFMLPLASLICYISDFDDFATKDNNQRKPNLPDDPRCLQFNLRRYPRSAHEEQEDNSRSGEP